MRPGHLGIYRSEELDVREYSVRNGGRGGGGGDISSLCFRAPLSTLYTLTPSPLLPLKPRWPLVLDNVTGKLRAINGLIKSSRESIHAPSWGKTATV